MTDDARGGSARAHPGGRGPRRRGRAPSSRASRRSEIERSAYRVAQEIDEGDPHRRRASTGSPLDDEEPYEPLRVDPAIEAEQRERLATLRAERDNAAVEGRAGRRCRHAAQGTDNVLYPMREALAAAGHRRRGRERAARGLGHLRPAATRSRIAVRRDAEHLSRIRAATLD